MILTSLLLAALAVPQPPRDRAHVLPCPSADGGWERIGGDAPTGPGGFDVTPDGVLVAFTSDADLGGRGASARDVWLLDRDKDLLEPISVDADGQLAGRACEPSLSADGRFVAFTSFAPLDPSDGLPFGDVFVRDRLLGVTQRLSRTPDGASPTGTSRCPSLSDDGDTFAFESFADDLLPGDDDGACDVFVGARERGGLVLLSEGERGACHDPVLSADGRIVAFVHDAPDAPREIVIVDVRAGTRERLPLGATRSDVPEGPFAGLSLSHDGSRLAFTSRSSELLPGLPADGHERVFVLERATRALSVQSVASDGGLADAACFHPSLSDDGRVLVFQSRATNLAPGEVGGFDHVYLRDLANGETQRVTVPAGGPGCGTGGDSVDPLMAGNGRTLLLASDANGLVPDDTNGTTDLFVLER